MKVDCTFKNIDGGQHLKEYIEMKLDRVTKYELKPSIAHFSFGKQRQKIQVEAKVVGPDYAIGARAESYDFHETVDKVVNKILGQMAKRKSKKQHHKNFERSRGGNLQRLTPELETDYSRTPHKKAA